MNPTRRAWLRVYRVYRENRARGHLVASQMAVQRTYHFRAFQRALDTLVGVYNPDAPDMTQPMRQLFDDFKRRLEWAGMRNVDSVARGLIQAAIATGRDPIDAFLATQQTSSFSGPPRRFGI